MTMRYSDMGTDELVQECQDKDGQIHDLLGQLNGARERLRIENDANATTVRLLVAVCRRVLSSVEWENTEDRLPDHMKAQMLRAAIKAATGE